MNPGRFRARILAMTTQTIKKLKAEIKRELVEEFIHPLLSEMRDAEGRYKAEFVKSVLKAAAERPAYRYDSKNFLKLLAAR